MKSPSSNRRQDAGFPALAPEMRAAVLAMLACPVCRAELRLEDAARAIVCAGCARRFPVADGIPVLIAEPK